MFDQNEAMDADTVIIEVADNAPLLTDIPDTSFQAGDILILSLDQYVSDCDHQVDRLQWTLRGQVNLAIDVDMDRLASISSPSGWTGSELVTFEISDPDMNATSDNALITVEPRTEVSGDERTDPLPEEYLLSQNYPNPFNPTTSIQYSVVSDQIIHHSPLVTLKIFNLLGQEVRTLVNELQEPGYYTVTWNGQDRLGQDVPSGIYFYRLTGGEFTEIRRMVLMK